MNFAEYFKHIDAVSITLFCILIALSLVSWVVAIIRLMKSLQMTKNIHADLTEKIGSAKASYAMLAFSERKTVVEQLLLKHIANYRFDLEKGAPVLGTTAAIAPFIGLFGTVWGIMNAFIGLSGAQSVSLNTVAPGIAEALIATAIGLFAAIPASLAFNYFTAKANRIYENRSLFCEELSNIFAYQNTLKQGKHS